MILKSHLNFPHPNPLDNCSCIAYMDRYLLLGNCSLRCSTSCVRAVVGNCSCIALLHAIHGVMQYLH